MHSGEANVAGTNTKVSPEQLHSRESTTAKRTASTHRVAGTQLREQNQHPTSQKTRNGGTLVSVGLKPQNPCERTYLQRGALSSRGPKKGKVREPQASDNHSSLALACDPILERCNPVQEEQVAL